MKFHVVESEHNRGFVRTRTQAAAFKVDSPAGKAKAHAPFMTLL